MDEKSTVGSALHHDRHSVSEKGVFYDSQKSIIIW